MIAGTAAAAALGIVLTGCAGGGSAGGGGGSANGTGTLTLGALVPPDTEAAAGAQWANQSPYVQAVYDSLLHETPDAAAHRRHVHRRHSVQRFGGGAEHPPLPGRHVGQQV